VIATSRSVADRSTPNNVRFSLLRQTALAGGVLATMMVLAPLPAGAAGGGAAGGADGLTVAGSPGGNGAGRNGGSGGGAGSIGGAGGTGGGVGASMGGAGGAGGATAGAAGLAGGTASGHDAGGGGGGGGAHGLVGIIPSTPGSWTTGPVTGGAGGAGGNSQTGGGPFIFSEGGSGGAGGYGIVASGNSYNPAPFTGGPITGGAGGAGGIGNYAGGAGGSGGVGLYFSESTNVGMLIGHTITGGAGGAGGASFGYPTTGTGAAGAGGAGIVGSNLSLSLSATVSGGLSGDGVTRANAITFTGGANALTFNTGSWQLIGGIDVTGSLAIDSTFNDTIANVISGSGSLTISHGRFASRMTTLSGANTYTGETVVAQGTLRVQSASALGSTVAGTVVNVGGALELHHVSGQFLAIGREALTLNGTGVAGGGALRGIAGTNLYEGPITLASATSITSQAGSLTLDGAIDLATHNLSLGGAGRINVNYIVSGAGAVAIDGATVTFRGLNSYAGSTTLNSGQLIVDGVGRLGQNANPLTVNGGTLTLYGNAANPPNTLSNYIVGSLSGTGGSIVGLVSSASTVKILEVDGATTTTYAGALSGNLRAEFKGGGTTTLTGAVSVTDAVIVTGAGTRVNFGAATGGVLNQKITSQIDVGTGATIAFSHDDTASISHQVSGGGSLIKLGTGYLTLNNLQGFTGAISVDSGTLELGSGVTLASSTMVTVLTGARFIYGNQLQLTQLAGTSLGKDNIALVSDATETFADAIGGGGRTLTRSGNGTLTLSGLLSYSGLTTVNGGTLELTNPNNTLTGGIVVNGKLIIGATGATGGANNTITTTGSVVAYANGVTNASPININSNTTQLEVLNTDSATQSGVISQTNGPRGFEKIGTGTLTLAANNTYSGVTVISAGTLVAGSTFAGVTPSAALGNDTATNIVRLNGGTLQIDNQPATFARPVEISALNGTLNNADALTLNGATTFTGTLTKTGAGNLTLNGAGSGAGGLIFNSAGTLEIGSNTALGTGTLRLQSGGTLQPGVASVSLANALVVDAATRVSTATGRALTLSGAISGAGSLTKVNAGTLDLTGANSFSGGMTLGGGTLGVGHNTALGTGQLSMAQNTTLRALGNVTLANAIQLQPCACEQPAARAVIDTNGNTLTLNGVISPGTGEGSPFGLTKAGAGTLVLNATNTYTGPTVVNAGSLVVNGSINASSGVTIAQGATLGGNGSTPALTVQGTISPGNSVGVLNINGGLTLTSTATTMIEIEGATADRINVTGNATLAGTLQLVAGGGTYTFTTPYTVLSATGTSSGTFAAVSTTGSFGVGVTSAVSYGAQNVQVTLTPAPLVTVAPDGPTTLDVAPTTTSSTETPGPTTVTTDSTTVAAPTTTTPTTTVLTQQTPVLGFNQTRNITAVAAALDRAAFSGSDMSSLFRVYNQPTREALAAAVNSLSGEVHTATTAAGLRASDQFLRVMLDPFAIGRDGSLVGTSGYAGFTADLPGRTGPLAAPVPVRFEPTFHVWGASFGQIDRTKGDATGAGSAQREVKDANIAVGADYRIAPGSVIGFALSGGQSRSELSRNLGSSTADIFQLGLYGATKIGKLNLAASLSYATMQVETRRNVPALGLGTISDYRADVWGGRLQAAYDLFSAGGFTVSPIAALQIQSVHTPNFRETNSFTGAAAGVSGRSHTNTALRTDLGLRLTSLTTLGGRKATLFTEIAWAHYFQRDITFAASLTGIANTNFVIEGARSNRDAALFSVGVDVQLTPNLTLGGRFDASASGNTTSFAGSGALRASF
jgi:outer membrane autotransporter protein